MSTQTPESPAPTTDQRRGTLRGVVDGVRSAQLSTSQKLMIFVLSMSLFGLSNIILEIIPDLSLGPVDVSVSYMVFVPLTIAALFSPFWAALGAPLGEIVFTDLLMGDFSGLAEVEGFLQMFLAVFIAGSLLRNPRSRVQIVLGAITLVLVDKVLSAIVDLSKVWIGVEDAEFVEGLPESMLALEIIGLGVDVLMSGILLGAIPALWLIPALHGKIEPLMGMRPRVPGEPIPGQAPASGVFVGFALLLSVASFGFAFLEAFDVSAGAFEPDYLDRFGDGFLLVSVLAIAVVLAGAIVLFRLSQRSKETADRS
ncbi:cell division protein FtsQ [Brachybacterium saurashtrense]|uniref:Cell division protein FtsQ n=1 Tax=Brachybacterium saurashtrense TaxID=556288 RepID=A0A345YQS3_9MICO|nr:cell division protein FtsQ [Brachybacterium saurashtrense]AXK46275.1 cell division protein FtsQ [Brachybacterium saurashtrense]RRR24015.1 cell division protein FtsQ [Brachybacterium saurashtrense]